jgi:4-hydroxybenzoate polyprenyltransferase
VTERTRAPRGRVRAIVAALRPRQWSKNLFVFAALVLTGQLGQPEPTRATVLTFLLFCAVSSAVYLVNDLVDMEQDRLHPVKRHRPLASGELPPVVAAVLAVLLAGLGLVGGLAVRPAVAGIVLSYLMLQLAYTLLLKHMIIVEVLAIAGGFVLRVWAGGAAIGEPISGYLYLSMIFLALFQGFAKRRHELTVLEGLAGEHRRSLDEYTLDLLDQFILIAATACLVTYSLYAITTPDLPAGVTHNMLLVTVPFVLYAVFRYLYLVRVRGEGGAPEDLLLSDRLLLLDVVGWALALLVILYLLPAL